MSWKGFQRVIWGLLAVCVGVGILMGVTDSMGLLLVIGPVDSTAVWGADFLIFLLALLAWGDGAIAVCTKGWMRRIVLSAVLAAEGFVLFVVLSFVAFFNTTPDYIPVYTPAGEVGLVVREESWLFSAWGEFYLPAGPCLLRGTGVTYKSHDIWPFAQGRYELEWEDDQAVIRYDTGLGAWETCIIPLD